MECKGFKVSELTEASLCYEYGGLACWHTVGLWMFCWKDDVSVNALGGMQSDKF